MVIFIQTQKLENMKQFFPILFLITFFSSLNAQPSAIIDWDAVIDRYAEKYQPEKIPQWIFPFIFENGIGQRDTVYFGHDDEASHFLSHNYPQDTLFGEEYITIDSNTFEVFWAKLSSCDTLCGLKVNITKFTTNFLYHGSQFYFINGVLPITLYYNTELFYSDSLPPPLSSGLPVLQAELYFSSGEIALGDWDHTLNEWAFQCPFDQAALVSDTLQPWWNPFHTFRDSIDINERDGFNVLYADLLSIIFKAWEGHTLAIETPDDKKIINVFPNPANDFLNIKFSQAETGIWKIYDIMGHTVHYGTFQAEEKIRINTRQLNSGFYFLHIEQNGQILIRKILIQNF